VFDDPSAPKREDSTLSYLPWFSIIPLVQYNRQSGRALVSPGDFVKEGMLIAEGTGKGSVNMYSPVPGKVIQNIEWNVPRSLSGRALVIRLEGEFSMLGRNVSGYEWGNLRTEEIQALIKEYGIVEMNGPGVPVFDMIQEYEARPESSGSLVVRCVFDDPWLVADYVLCKERLAALAEGIFIAAKGIGAARIVLAVSAPEKKLGAEILAAMKDFRESAAQPEAGKIPVSFVLVGARYPQRNSLELETALRQFERQEEIHLGKLFFLSPATVCAVFDAVKYHRPVLDRYVAVGGTAVRYPKVLKARIGSRLSQLIDECGGFVSAPKRTATGTPFLAQPVFNPDEPLLPVTFAVFAVSKEKPALNPHPRVLELRMRDRTEENTESGKRHKLKYVAPSDCLSCGDCRSICPIGLDPEKIHKMIRRNIRPEFACLCHGCGCCEAVCPSGIPLSRLIFNYAHTPGDAPGTNPL